MEAETQSSQLNADFDPSLWRENHQNADYADPDYLYEDYEPAYRYGEESFLNRSDGTFDDNEERLAVGWERFRDASRLTWQQAREAVRDAWHRLEEGMPGDADGDGR